MSEDVLNGGRESSNNGPGDARDVSKSLRSGRSMSCRVEVLGAARATVFIGYCRNMPGSLFFACRHLSIDSDCAAPFVRHDGTAMSKRVGEYGYALVRVLQWTLTIVLIRPIRRPTSFFSLGWNVMHTRGGLFPPAHVRVSRPARGWSLTRDGKSRRSQN